MKTILRWLMAACVAVGSAHEVVAQVKPPTDLAHATLEDLMNIEITSASRKEQRADEVPAAVYVITHDDIRRSGLTSVPDLLRLAPGVQVAQINSNKWAVSVRGFNGVFSNKLLVLVDGRSVYNPLFSSVLWDSEDLMLEDVDRIEIIRGPGAAVWGANAVNGVINIMTTNAAESQGTTVRVGGGTFDTADAAVRYGGRAGPASYRLFSQLSEHGNSLLAPGTAAPDHWRSFTNGFRVDGSAQPGAYMLEGSMTAGVERALWMNLDPASAARQAFAAGESDTLVGHVLGRWTHTRENGGALQLQSFVDVAHRNEPISDYRRHTVDVDAQYHTALGARQDLVVGGGYRFIDEAMAGGVGYTFTPDKADEALFNAFAQDEIALAANRVRVTLGAKFEHDTYGGANLQPTARLMWDVEPRRQHLWAAVSRALRTPSLANLGVGISFPPVMTATGLPLVINVVGNPAFRNEELVNSEAGYRFDVGNVAAVDVTAFYGRYDNLQTTEPGTGTLVMAPTPHLFVIGQFENRLSANTRGLEVAARWKPARIWQLDATYTAFHLTPHPDAGSHDPSSPTFDGHAPHEQWGLRSAVTLAPRVQVDAMLFHVGALATDRIAAYTRADARLEWKLSSSLSAIADGQNLLDHEHAEFIGTPGNLVSTLIPRSAAVRLVWRF